MRIDHITLREIHLPLIHFFQTSFGRTTSRRILLIEVDAEGFSGWGECTAGEHPYFSTENTDTAWHMLRSELAPLLLGREVQRGSDCPSLFRRIRGNRMAKAALENAIWDLEAQMSGVSLARLLGGSRLRIPAGVSIGIQDSESALLDKVATELAAGYQRIKLKCEPGWDIDIFAAVRHRWPDIMLSCDANSAYTLDDLRHLIRFDEYNLLMIEQPLWHDDFYFHAELQRALETAICLDESIRSSRDAEAAIQLGACRILNVKLGRVGGFTEAVAIHDAAARLGIPLWCGGMLESGIGRAHNIALSSLPQFSLPGDVSASRRYWAQDIIEPEVTVSHLGEITIPTTPGRGYEVNLPFVESLTARRDLLQS